MSRDRQNSGSTANYFGPQPVVLFMQPPTSSDLHCSHSCAFLACCHPEPLQRKSCATQQLAETSSVSCSTDAATMHVYADPHIWLCVSCFLSWFRANILGNAATLGYNIEESREGLVAEARESESCTFGTWGRIPMSGRDEGTIPEWALFPYRKTQGWMN